MWENKTNGSTATFQMRLSGKTGNAMNAHVDVIIAPKVDGSAFLKLVELTRDDPNALQAIDSVMAQIAQFACKNLPPQ